MGRKLSIATAVVAAGSLVACSAASQTTHQNVVNALWYGKQSDGSLQSGITKVTIKTNQSGTGDFTADLTGLEKSGTGEVWNAAAWSGSAIATLATATSPRGLTVNLSVNESIDGPSAGGLMTTGVMADLTGGKIVSDATMTGTIMPNGGIGPVGGIPEKLRAASAAGMKRVLIPAGQRISNDPRTGRSVDVIEEGKQLGMEVREISSIADSYQALVENPVSPSATADPGPLDAELVDLLRNQATEALARISDPKFGVAPAPGQGFAGTYKRMVAGAAAAKQGVPEQLAKNDMVAAYALAALTERELLSWNALSKADADASVSAEGMKGVRTVLAAQADSIKSRAGAALSVAAGTSVQFLEQLAALPDTLTWASDAEATATANSALLTDPSHGAESDTGPKLGQIAAELARAQYDLDYSIKTSLKAVEIIGKRTVENTSPILNLLSSYATFLAEAGDANMNYYEVSNQGRSSYASDLYNEEFARQLAKRWETKAQDKAVDQAAVMSRLSVAVSYFIASTTLVAGAEALAAVAPGADMLSRVRIADQENFKRQVEVSGQENSRLAGILAGVGLDSSYFRWNSEWGLKMANAPQSTGASDSIRSEGLSYQWYENVAAKLLLVMQRS